MKEKMIIIIVKKPQEKAEQKMVENEYKVLSGLVEGYIECVDIGNGVDMICNEEGKFNGMNPNLAFTYDTIVGPVFFCSSDGEDFASLSDEQIKFVTDKITKTEM